MLVYIFSRFTIASKLKTNFLMFYLYYYQMFSNRRKKNKTTLQVQTSLAENKVRK